MPSNYTVLQQNTLDGLSETASILYLKLLDVFEAHVSRANERKAFFAACEYDEKSGCVIDHIIRRSPVHNLSEEVITQLSAFFSERWRNNFMQEKTNA